VLYEGSGHPSAPQPPPSTAQPTHEEPIPNVVLSSHQRTQTPRQALNQVTELPQTSEPIPNVADEAVYEEWDDRVERDTTTAASLDAEQASGGSTRCQEAMRGSIVQTRSERGEDQPKDQLGVLSAAKVLADAAKTNVASMPVSTAGMVQEVNISIPSLVVFKDKGKGKMEESKDEQTKRSKLQQEQERLGHKAEEWENIRARVEADEELFKRLQAEEINKYNEVDQAKMLVDLINQRKKYFATQKAEAKRNKPITQAQ
ncbi:hypothetical protein Tco_1339985, partial [Tanacetum coccineum]